METQLKNGPAGWTILQHQLEGQLEQIQKDEPTVVKRATRSLQITNSLFKQLESSVLTFPFDKTEEVLFYKHIRPFFTGHILFFQQLLKIEAHRPPFAPSGLQEYYIQELSKIDQLFNDHRFIKNYIEFGSTAYDHLFFFKPDSEATLLLMHSPKTLDGAFPVCYDDVVAQLIAADLLKKHLLEAIEDLILPGHAPGIMPNIIWTAPKAHLVEFGYAFKAAKVFNNGNATIKDIMDCLQLAFHAKVGNYARIFQEVCYRHAGPTVAQDGAKNDYLLMIQTLDDRHMAA